MSQRRRSPGARTRTIAPLRPRTFSQPLVDERVDLAFCRLGMGTAYGLTPQGHAGRPQIDGRVEPVDEPLAGRHERSVANGPGEVNDGQTPVG